MQVCSNRCPDTILGGEFVVSQELRLDNQPLRLGVASAGRARLWGLGGGLLGGKVRTGLHLLHV